MLQRLELINYESHEHSVIDMLSPGFNLIYGLSNAGKTTIVRAISLVSYNIFNPKSVRHGCDNCTVIATTDKGKVKVTRGKVNEWEVTPINGTTSHFKKVGKTVIPLAAEIMGLKMVKLGDTELSINIMNQLESHFMLSELNGQSSTGSMRAQVVDEISGLSGVETLVRDVSLDNHRLGRDIKSNEDLADGIKSKLHDILELQTEDSILQLAKEKIESHEQDLLGASELASIVNSHSSLTDSSVKCKTVLNALPDTQSANQHLTDSSSATAKAVIGLELVSKSTHVTDRVDIVNAAILETNKADRAKPSSDRATVALSASVDRQRIFDSAELASKSIKNVQSRIKSIQEMSNAESSYAIANDAQEKINPATVMVQKANDILSRKAEIQKGIADAETAFWAEAPLNNSKASFAKTDVMNGIWNPAYDLALAIANVEDQITLCTSELKKATKERDDLLKQITVCPLTQLPISDVCKTTAKGL